MSKVVIAGIDVSVAHLDVAVSGQKLFRVKNSEAGHKQLATKFLALGVTLVVVEATGGYQQGLHLALSGAGLNVALINPRVIRDYARSRGLLEKTDALDARVLQAFGEERNPTATPAPSERVLKLKGLVARRRQVKETIAREKNRAAHPFAACGESIDRTLNFLANEVKLLDKAIQKLVTSHDDWKARQKRLCTIPGVGALIAAVLIAELPELGTLGHKQIAKLAGVAPLPWDSGKMRGQRHIAGGRTYVRSMLYMAVLVGLRFNPTIKPFYKKLVSAHKPGLVAMVASMRKLLSIINAMERDQKDWQTPSASEKKSV